MKNILSNTVKPIKRDMKILSHSAGAEWTDYNWSVNIGDLTFSFVG